jgi:hypothetical protein
MSRLDALFGGNMALRVAGTLLLLAGVGLGALTERDLLLRRAATERHGGEVTDVGTTGSRDALHGSMVRVAGPIDVIEAPRDPDFNLSVPTPVLVRHVEMFQWREVRIGDSVHYEVDWVDHPVDARGFMHPAGHANPGGFPVSGKQFDAGLVQVGGFALGPELLHALPGTVQVTPDIRHLPANLAASFSSYQRWLVTSADPGHPKLGDVRVSWDAVPLQTVTLFARLDGDRLVPAADAADGKGYDVQVGDRTLSEVLPDVPMAPEFVQIRRGLAMLLATLGAYLLLWEHQRRDPLLALGMGAALVAAVACVLWLGGGMPMVLRWLVIALAGVGVTLWRLRRPA